MKKIMAITLLLTVNTLQAQDSLKYNLGEIVVTSLHKPALLFDVNKSIEIIPTETIKTAPINSVQDFLKYSNSIELNQRGANGVQADIGIRGGNFEQTLIMLDGIKIIDPQTGHHNLNLPITALNIEKIEIIKGNSSNINGANAFSGLVNFRTKRNKFNSLSIKTEGGDFGLYSASLFGSYNIGNLSNNFSLERDHSNGYRGNTEYNITNISYGGSYTTSKSVFDFLAGYTDKSFGANSFYTIKFPLQFEKTRTTFAKVSVEFGSDNLNYTAKAYWRKSDDEFLLDKTNHAFYKNNHVTNIYGSEIDLFMKSKLGNTSVGTEYVYDRIMSNNLGNHNRNRMGIFIEHKFLKFNKVSIGISGFLYNYSTVGTKFWPGLDVGYSVSKNINIFANYSSGFRIPTYTELFYSSPTTKGNPNLTFEETTNYEIGGKFFNEYLTISTSIFYNDATNIIDWVLLELNAPWTAMNIAKLKTSGFEFNSTLNFKSIFNQKVLNSVSIKYTYLNSDYSSDKNYTSRYLLKYLKNQAILSINHNLLCNVKVNWYFRYEERLNFEKNLIVDLGISKLFNNFSVFAKATNLFNINYFNFIGVPLPGRWITGGIKLSFK